MNFSFEVTQVVRRQTIVARLRVLYELLPEGGMDLVTTRRSILLAPYVRTSGNGLTPVWTSDLWHEPQRRLLAELGQIGCQRTSKVDHAAASDLNHPEIAQAPDPQAEIR